MSDTSAKIYEKISAVMNEVGAIGKTQKNTQQGYFFRGIDDVYAALQPALIKHGIFFVPNVLKMEREERQNRSGGALIYTNLQVEYTFFAADGSSVRAVVAGEAMDSGDKSTNKAMSAALKYALLQIFCIPTESNEDADAVSHDVAPKANGNTKPFACSQSLKTKLFKLNQEAEAAGIKTDEIKKAVARELGSDDFRSFNDEQMDKALVIVTELIQSTRN